MSRDIYLIGDTHFDHTKIRTIYCKRPFHSNKEMNEAMLDNWNSTVHPKDIVYFLGDLAYDKEKRGTDY
ncbi:MAG: hypothetical protein KKF46_05170 [Nanoarchaeota archaeon]|nr:hypothetical protein [Nanoarchaeota archaeon]MBU1321724.1 hypothetical protein [Nanoarchaeota archaeon]MBU1597690.1 hypothetical protein [Nanoarchaeota archaeon]MBU2440748.1 hypothetical protein [Nanoarchaeota archaeon]